jgi:hypothetical protein
MDQLSSCRGPYRGRTGGKRIKAAPTLGAVAATRPKCSFCGKDEEGLRVVAGPAVAICAECVQLCCDIFWPDPELPWSVPKSGGTGAS